GGIYAETCALWLVLFFCLTFGVNLAEPYLPAATPPLLLSGAVMLLSLVALLWPVARGIPWQQVRQEVGLTAGRQPLVEPLTGVACYAMTLPLLALGIFLTLILVVLQRGLAGDGPGVMALAYGFTLTREWRGSLVAPMVAHGVNNGLLMLFAMLALGD